MSEGEALASPRPRDTEAAGRARKLIEDTLRSMDVGFNEIETGTVQLPRVEILGAVYREAHPITVEDPSVIARFGPSGKALLVMAHYDSVPGSPGACDNAAAVAILLELARVLKSDAPQRPVILAFTAAEEVGLVGAEALAARFGGEIEFAISLDLIGGDGPLVLNGASTLIGRAELAWLVDAADHAGVDLSPSLGHRVVSRWWPQAERSDHGPFTRRGIRAVHLYNRGNDGEWIDTAYHSERDVWSRVHRDQVAAVGRLVRALVASPTPSYDTDGYVVPVVHVVLARWALIAIELVLALIAAFALARRREPLGPGAGLLVGLACYVVALVLAVVAERMVLPYSGAWLLAPLRMTIAFALVLGGTFGLLTRLVARFTMWTGALRYRAFAALTCLVFGLALIAVGAAELAWIWLVPAAVIAIAPAPLGLVSALLPPLLLLHPLQLREAAWNSFLSPQLPLASAIGFLGAPTIAVAAFTWRDRRPRPGPLGTLVLGLGCGLAVSVGIVVAITAKTTCSSAEFWHFSVACDRV
jgi:hypothetical protein